MPLSTGVYSIIHAAADADFTAYTYNKVYAGAAETPTINGVSVTMAAGSDLDITVRSISGTANVYVLGDKKNVTDGPQTLNGYPNP